MTSVADPVKPVTDEPRPSGSHVEQAESPLISDEISLFDVGSVVLVYRWLILTLALLAAAIAVLPVSFHSVWTARASFIVEGEEAEPSAGGLRRLAGQLGVPVSLGGSLRQSPEFYGELLSSRRILSRLLDAQVVPAAGAEPVTVNSLLELEDVPPARREEAGIRVLRELVKLESTNAGVLRVAATTRWPSASAVLANRAVEEVNRFNLESGQSRAVEERRFVAARLADQQRVVADAERRLAAFLTANREFRRSPQLTFQYDRLQNEWSLAQRVLAELAQANEQARLRAVRDVRTVTVIDSATAPLRPDPRGRTKRLILGLLTGALVGVFVGLTRELLQSRYAAHDPAATRFVKLLRGTGRRRRRSASARS